MFASGAPTWARQWLRVGQALKRTNTQSCIRLSSSQPLAPPRPLTSNPTYRSLNPFVTPEPQGDYLFDPCPKQRDYEMRLDFEIQEKKAAQDPSYFTFGETHPQPTPNFESYDWENPVLGRKEKRRAANLLLRKKFAQSEPLDSVHSLIQSMKAEGVTMSLRTLTILVEKYSDEGLFYNIDHVLKYMEDVGVQPDAEFIHATVRAYGVGANPAGVERVVEFGKKQGVEVDGKLKNLLVEFYAFVDDREKVEQLMEELWNEGRDGSGPLEEPLPVYNKTYLEVMKMLCRVEDFDAAEKMFWDMLFTHNMMLDIPSFNLIFRSRMDAGDRMGARKMIAKYGEFKKVDCEAGNSEMFKGDDVTYNLFVQFLATEYDQLNLTAMCEHMEEMAFELHPDSFPSVLRSSAVCGDERKVDEIWEWFEKQHWPGKETLKRDSFHIGMSELLMQRKGYEAEKALQQMDKEGHYPTRVTYRLMRETYLHKMDLERCFEILREDYPKMDLPVSRDDAGLIYQAMFRNQGVDGILRCIDYHEARNEVPSLYALQNFFYSLSEPYTEDELKELLQQIQQGEVFLVKQGWAIYVLIRGLMERNRTDLVEDLVLRHLQRVPSESEFARYLHLLMLMHYNNKDVEMMEKVLGKYETKTEPETRSYMLLRRLYAELGMDDKAEGVTSYLRKRYIETPELERGSQLLFGQLETKPDFWVEWEESKKNHEEAVMGKIRRTIYRDDYVPVPMAREETAEGPLKGIAE